MCAVGCDLHFRVTEPSSVAFQVAPATSAGEVHDEQITCTGAGGALVPIREITDRLGGRIQVVDAEHGPLTFAYAASVAPRDASAGGGGDTTPDAIDLDAIEGLRQSRYCPSDALVGFAAAEFPSAREQDAETVAREVATWVFERLTYTLGSSGPLDTALHTLHAGAGVCRDFGHLAITLCRALGVPARFAAVYAPGLSPMDFHAVVEARTSTGWQVLDPSRLAPRQTLVRIATGRDASDTAFATTVRGDVELVSSRVFASTDGDLPADDHVGPMRLA